MISSRRVTRRETHAKADAHADEEITTPQEFGLQSILPHDFSSQCLVSRREHTVLSDGPVGRFGLT
jgi:hypothetical protein